MEKPRISFIGEPCVISFVTASLPLCFPENYACTPACGAKRGSKTRPAGAEPHKEFLSRTVYTAQAALYSLKNRKKGCRSRPFFMDFFTQYKRFYIFAISSAHASAFLMSSSVGVPFLKRPPFTAMPSGLPYVSTPFAFIAAMMLSRPSVLPLLFRT